tara:strand:- start:666 stop:860 length:195 start_codon:yes stop_codon:yes gene_type:complete
MKLGSLNWSNPQGTGQAKLSADFLEQNWVVQADSLKDWICDLQKYYTQLLVTHKEITQVNSEPL